MNFDNRKKLIGPSILNADSLHLGESIANASVADYLHIDIMDGHFVPNIAFGPDTVKEIRKYTSLPLHCHLMVDNPLMWGVEFAELGVDSVTVHAEAINLEDLSKLADEVHKRQVGLGLSFKPDTSVELWEEAFNFLDRALIMSVYPGFGGQKFLTEVLPKAAVIRNIQHKLDREIIVEIDGGINAETIKVAAEAEIDCFVAGSYVYASNDIRVAIETLQRLAN